MENNERIRAIAVFYNTNETVLSRLPNEVCLGHIELNFYKELDVLESGQIGYAIEPNGKIITEWNSNWIVIGEDCSIGDPYIVDSSTNQCAVFTASHGQGEWRLRPIADSLTAFMLSVAVLSTVTNNRITPKALENNPISVEEKYNVLNQIQLVNTLNDYSYWEALLE